MQTNWRQTAGLATRLAEVTEAGQSRIISKTASGHKEMKARFQSKGPSNTSQEHTAEQTKEQQLQPARRANSSSRLGGLSAVYVKGVAAKKLHIPPSAAGTLAPNEAGD